MLLQAGCSQGVDITDIPTNSPTATITQYPTATAAPTDIPTSTLQPTQTPEPNPVKAQTLPLGDSIQTNLFGLVPPDSLSAGYCDFQQIREDSELISAFELVPDICPFLFSPIPGGRVDQLIAFGRKPDDPVGVMMGIIYLFYGDFIDVSLPELIQEFEFEDLVLRDYQGFEYMVEEQGEPFNSAVMIMNEATIVFGEESGVLAVIDATLGLSSSPLADLGAVLPPVLTASVLSNCPKYEDLGCTALVIHSLAQGIDSDLLLLQVYQFEEADFAANALDTIKADIESGNTIQFGSMKISGDTITRDGRFIIIEDVLPIENIGSIFE
jgi:hypothetical protein